MELKSFLASRFVERLGGKNMHVCIYSQCVNAFIYAREMRECMKAPQLKGLAVFSRRKKPANGRVCLKRFGLAGVHAPPEDVTEDDDLLFLDFLEAIVLVRMFIAIEAAQTNAGRQAVKLLYA